MKYFTRAGIYKANNVTFNPKTIEAHSYSWWKFVDVIENKVIFNSYRYSVSTSKHQKKVLGLMHDLGIKIDHFLELPQGICSCDLELLFILAEEELCRSFLEQEIKREDRNEKARERRMQAKANEQALAQDAKNVLGL